MRLLHQLNFQYPREQTHCTYYLDARQGILWNPAEHTHFSAVPSPHRIHCLWLFFLVLSNTFQCKEVKQGIRPADLTHTHETPHTRRHAGRIHHSNQNTNTHDCHAHWSRNLSILLKHVSFYNG
jgi:hypothetical protein